MNCMDIKKIKLLSKRQKIVLASIILSLGLLSTQLVPFYLTYRFILGLTALAYLLSLFALWEGINKLKAVILIILPTLFTLAVTSYYFLLPVRWLTRLPVAVAFGLVFYTLLLSQNIFNVASTRTIPLYRVASTTVFVLTIATAFLLYNVMFSFHLSFYWNFLITFLLTFPLSLQVIWSIEMEGLSALVVIYSFIISLVTAQLAMFLSFWPVYQAMASLMLLVSLYTTIGIATSSLRDRLSRGVVWEHAAWGILVFLVITFTTSWTG